MSSLRLALKLSMAEAQPESSETGRAKGKKGNTQSESSEKSSKFELEGPTLDEVLGRKRKSSTSEPPKEQGSKGSSSAREAAPPPNKSMKIESTKRNNDKSRDSKKRTVISTSSASTSARDSPLMQEDATATDADVVTAELPVKDSAKKNSRINGSETSAVVSKAGLNTGERREKGDSSIETSENKKKKTSSDTEKTKVDSMKDSSKSTSSAAAVSDASSKSGTVDRSSKNGYSNNNKKGSSKLAASIDVSGTRHGDNDSKEEKKNGGQDEIINSTVKDAVDAVVDDVILTAASTTEKSKDTATNDAEVKIRNRKKSTSQSAANQSTIFNESKIHAEQVSSDEVQEKNCDSERIDSGHLSEEDRLVSRKRKRDTDQGKKAKASSEINKVEVSSTQNDATEKADVASAVAQHSQESEENSNDVIDDSQKMDIGASSLREMEQNQIEVPLLDANDEASLKIEGSVHMNEGAKKAKKKKKETSVSKKELKSISNDSNAASIDGDNIDNIQTSSVENIEHIYKVADTTGSRMSDDEKSVDLLPRYQSNRAAAIVAKSKLSTTTKSDAGDSSQRGGKDRPLPMDGADSSAVINAASKKKSSNAKKKRVIESDGMIKELSKSADNAAAAEEDTSMNWVQCERCLKWRTVPSNVSESDLPDIWYCEMNTWNEKYNTCSSPEEVVQKASDNSISAAPEAETHLERQQQAREKNNSKINARSNKSKKSNSGQGQTNAVGDAGGGRGATEEENSNADGKNKSRALGGVAAARRRGVAQNSSFDTNSVVMGSSAEHSVGLPNAPSENWVQCNKCKKWRKVPASISVEKLPERWYCTMNTWAPAFARCSVKQEGDGSAVGPGQVSQLGGVKGKKTNSNNNLAANIDNEKGAVIKQVSWVQCERRNCKKWRKVPATIDIDSLPEKWYCEMNTWNLDVASCDVPEDSDSDDNPGAKARNQFILANSKGPGALSYRRMIFGTDGRIRVCFSDKNKNGYGIFSYSETHKPTSDADDYQEPTRRVSYWYSSAYDDSKLNCVSNSINSVAGSTAPSAKNSKKNNVVVAENTTESEVSTRVENPSHSKPPAAASYLLDTIRRLHTMQLSASAVEGSVHSAPADFTTTGHSLEHCWPRKLSRSWKIVSRMPLCKRSNAEAVVVMSCFLGATRTLPINPAAIQTQPLQMSKLYDLIRNSRFPDEELEACRECMSLPVLKDAVHRLEVDGKLEVTYTTGGQLAVSILPSVAQLTTSNFQNRGAASAALGISSAWTKLGMPLKMRKFFSKSHAREAAIAAAEALAERSANTLPDTVDTRVDSRIDETNDQKEIDTHQISKNGKSSPKLERVMPKEANLSSPEEVLTKPFRLRHSAERWQSP